MSLAKDRLDELYARGFGEADSEVCIEHILDPALKNALLAQVSERQCGYCERNAADHEPPFAVRMEDLVTQVVNAIRRHYGDANNEGVPWDNEDGYIGANTYDIDDVVYEVCSGAFSDDTSDELVQAVISAIGWDTTWTDTGLLSLDLLGHHWGTFSKIIKTTTRFMIRPGEDYDAGLISVRLGSSTRRERSSTTRERRSSPPHQLGSFLEYLLHYVDGEMNLLDDLPAGTEFYRGRLMDRPDKVKPTVQSLRPAPPDKASANRMSPAGISMFYASADPQTAIAEIASHGPEPYALIGTFRSTRPLKLLDLTRRPSVPSYFDEARYTEFSMARFLDSFVQAITAPVIPDGRQHVEYTPTQVLTEYLRWVPNTVIDGIALPSAQSPTGAKTYVLFFNGEDCATAEERAAAQVEPRGTLLDFDLPDVQPTFTLARGDIHVWEVQRTYTGRPYEPFGPRQT